ncbi:glycosyltransferase family 2 protein [Adhaeribacter radiodurans]|uniref:Glycosyltransferase n=1 Tax=Adhaeribacter radiodurans TaxID=2745197 RepID=A0A7L7L466_9BACT|nr:glycosyltransferase family 2 protein [Adhaeribacter radiodurans]QMU27563.1 glycosyltransferase [Adhaeribacter radiodurans]
MIKISIITINYNNVIGLEETIKSVVGQTYTNIEYIIIDGGSSDGSVNIIKENKNHIYYWVSEPDNGIYHAMNKGLAKANGDFLIFLNSGDYLCSNNIIQICYEFIIKFPGNDIYYGDMIVINDINSSESRIHKHPNKITLKFLKDNNINHQASLISLSLFKEFGPYLERYKLASDFWFFLKAILKNKNFKHIDFPIVNYDFSGISSSDNFEKYKQEKLLIWQSLVPDVVNELINENDKYKNLIEFKIIKAAILLNDKYQYFKGNT